MPPVRDVLVLGNDCPIGCEAWRKALKVLQPEEFTHIELAPGDDVLQRHPDSRQCAEENSRREAGREIIMRRFKPVIDPHECLHLQITAELHSEDQV